jgi:ribosomal protein S18 acetylase RimI-like enzyme
MTPNLITFSATNQFTNQISQLHLAGLRDTDSFSLDPELDKDLLNVEQAYADGLFLLAADKSAPNTIVGMGALKRVGEHDYHIKRMRVLATMRRQGIGQLLLVALIAAARKMQIDKLTLDTSLLQVAAQKLYEKNGFVHVGDVVISTIASKLYTLHL